ncbi:MAG: M48 family metalloprotease, partial [Planctomycetaceae bacterium]|nr:M48 family metalloprotease [Planctomycetaceae bacterium]
MTDDGFITGDWQVFSLRVVTAFAHFLWQGTLVGITLAVALRFGSRRSASFRFMLCAGGLLALPVCVVTTFFNPGTAVSASNEASITATGAEALVNAPNATNPSTEASQPPSLPQLKPSSVMSHATEPSLILPERAIPRMESTTTWRQWFVSISPAVLVTYLLVTSVFLVRLSRSLHQSHQLRRSLSLVSDPNLKELLRAQAVRIGLRRIPAIAVCDRVAVPMVIGLLRPVVLLPPVFLSLMDSGQMAAIVTHELAHIRRCDTLLNLLQRLIEAFLFFHPVTWWISRQVNIERENCCDDIAAETADPLTYAGALLRLAELCICRNGTQEQAVAIAALQADGGRPTELGNRIRRLLHDQPACRVSLSWRSLAVPGLLLCILSIPLAPRGGTAPMTAVAVDEPPAAGIFTPEPTWQVQLENSELASEMTRVSQVALVGNIVITGTRSFSVSSGTPTTSIVTPPADPDENGFRRSVERRRRSADRQFVIESYFVTPPPQLLLDTFTTELRVIRCSDGAPVGRVITVNGYSAHGSAMDVEAGGDFLLYGSGQTAHVYRVETGAIETTLPVQLTRIDALAISPDRDWLVVSDRNKLHFWRWRDQAPVQTIDAGRKIDSLVFTPDGQYLAEGPDSRVDIQIRDMRSLQIVASLQDEAGSPLMVSSMDISPDGRFLVAHNEVSVDPTKLTIPHRVHVWDLRTRKPVYQVATGEWVRSVSFSNDGKVLLADFTGAAHGALLAGWRIPEAILQADVDISTDTDDRLGDGIQWSRWGDRNGLLSGARVLAPGGQLRQGEPLVVEYRLANVSSEEHTLSCLLNKGMQFPSLGPGNRISDFGLDWNREPVELRLAPGEVFVDTEHRVTIDTTGLEPGNYSVALGSAFRYSDPTEPNVTHEIPHRGSIPFALTGTTEVSLHPLQNAEVHWGPPVAGLQLGAKWSNDEGNVHSGSVLEAEMFVTNITDQPISCTLLFPHPQDGWLFNVEDSSGHTHLLDRPIPYDTFSPQRYAHLQLAPHEVVEITADELQVSYSPKSDDTTFASTTRGPRLWIGEASSSEDAPQPGEVWHSLKSTGGDFTATFQVTLRRTDIPTFRLNLHSGDVPFTVQTPAE